ncbi:MAG TPA: dual specificity protein phosphatase family protein [Terriglobales bacterium]|jgi:protein-tyrosine phosphatase
MKCSRIANNLFIGPSLHDPNGFGELRSLGITAILSLQSEEDIGEHGLLREKEAAFAAELAFRNVPVNDFDSADLETKLLKCVQALDGMLTAGHTVYLHCTAGVSRSPTVAAAYLHWQLAWPLDQALLCVRKARKCSPNAEAIRHAHWRV